LNDLPVRYTQSIYKQYTIFLKDQEAQKAVAAEDMMEELEDGGMSGISHNNAKHPPTSNDNMVSIREQQLAAIRRNIAKAEEQQGEDFKPADDPQTKAIREAQLAKLQADIMGGNQ
jgi:hypothetical protein